MGELELLGKLLGKLAGELVGELGGELAVDSEGEESFSSSST